MKNTLREIALWSAKTGSFPVFVVLGVIYEKNIFDKLNLKNILSVAFSVSYKKGYAFSFHQNEPDENGNFKSVYGRYTEAEYDRIANELAEKYNQQSIYDCKEDKLIENPHYNPKLNPMKP